MGDIKLIKRSAMSGGGKEEYRTTNFRAILHTL